MAKKNGSLKLKIADGDGILETTRKWNEAQREDKNV